MSDSIVSHMSIGVSDLDRAGRFYDRLLTTVGARRVMEHPGAIAYGKAFPEFWVCSPIDGTAPTVGSGTHVGFLADSREAVDSFHREALAAGATDDGAPGPRPLYGAPYYGCFVRDPDGHKIEASFWDATLAEGEVGG